MFNFRINNFSDATQSLDKIPKIIHQTYKNHDLPEIYQRCQTEIKRFHPISKKNDDHMDQLKMSGCYGMHVCTGLWRNKKL